MLADHLEGPLARDVTTVGVDGEVRRLRELTDRFAETRSVRLFGHLDPWS